MYLTADINGYVGDPVCLRGVHGDVLFMQIKQTFPSLLKELRIPASVQEDKIKSGGFWGTTCPMLVVSHPNPPSPFFDIGIVVNDHTVSFPLLGKSEQYAKIKLKKFYERDGRYSRAAVIYVDEFLLQQEDAWQKLILDAFLSILS